MANTLIVIPVRGGSVGLPRKALRLLGGRPVLAWTFETCAQIAADICVISDDTEILQFARDNEIAVLREAPKDGLLPLDGSVYTAVCQMEIWHSCNYQLIVTVQATSPFLSPDTIRRCIQEAPAETVRDDRHPRVGGPMVPRQQLPPCWRITGGCVAAYRQDLTPTMRRSPVMGLVEVSGAEALDLDTEEDWVLAEWYAERSAIAAS